MDYLPIFLDLRGRTVLIVGGGAVALRKAGLLAASNILTAEELDIHVSIGIDYGKILIVNEDDIFGDAVNRACKMGEDIGTAGDILITKEAMDLIPEEGAIQGKPIEVSIGGLSIPAFSIVYRTNTEEEQQ